MIRRMTEAEKHILPMIKDRKVTIFRRNMSEDDWALAVNGFIKKTGTRAQIEEAYQKWMNSTLTI